MQQCCFSVFHRNDFIRSKNAIENFRSNEKFENWFFTVQSEWKLRDFLAKNQQFAYVCLKMYGFRSSFSYYKQCHTFIIANKKSVKQIVWVITSMKVFTSKVVNVKSIWPCDGLLHQIENIWLIAHFMAPLRLATNNVDLL